MRWLAERAYFTLCLALGRLLRAARYSKVDVVVRDAEPEVRKRRAFYAPLLIWVGGPLVRVLGTGTCVLPKRDWEDRERLIYGSLYGAVIRVDADGTLVLPRLRGKTLADLLEDAALEESTRTRAIELAVAALVRFHALGFTHADAMAENVLVDLEAGAAHWFDFETVHDASRPMAWRRADDLRALLATCLVRTAPEKRGATVQRIVEAYADEAVTRLLAPSFDSAWRRSLMFHLGQAPLSFQCFREIDHFVSRFRRA